MEAYAIANLNGEFERPRVRCSVARSPFPNGSTKVFFFLAIDGPGFRGIKRKQFRGRERGKTEHKERQIERAWRRRIPRDREDGFFCISFPDSLNAENLSVCNENHYELTFLSRVLSTPTAPLWISTLIMVYLISI